MTIPTDYYNILAAIESGGNPNAKASTSSASGLYQFTKGTWTSLGFDWSNVFDVGQQNQAIQVLTNQNASILSNNNIPINNQSLYAAHFFGAGTASDILGASNGTPISSLVSANAISANPFLSGMNVGEFKNWLNSKVSVGQSSGSDNSGAGGTILDQAIGGAFQGLSNILGLGNAVDAAQTGDAAGNIFDWIKNFFSAATASRFVAVIAGVGLVIVAIIFLTNADKIIVETGKAAAMAA